MGAFPSSFLISATLRELNDLDGSFNGSSPWFRALQLLRTHVRRIFYPILATACHRAVNNALFPFLIPIRGILQQINSNYIHVQFSIDLVFQGRMALLVTLFLVLVNIFNAITTNSPKADGLNALQVRQRLTVARF